MSLVDRSAKSIFYAQHVHPNCSKRLWKDFSFNYSPLDCVLDHLVPVSGSVFRSRFNWPGHRAILQVARLRRHLG